jgi:predicted TIM-barrel fold metal-dependent hydrolase
VTPQRYEYGIDFDAVDAIDIHTHVEIDSADHGAYDPGLAEATRRYFKLDPGHAAGVDDLAEHYRRNNTAAVVFTVDARTASGHPPNSVTELIEGAVRNNDVLIPFGTVDPWRDDAVRRVAELTGDFGVKGFKFHPSLQAFEPNDRRFYPVYEAIEAAGVPALFHTGQTGLGSALPWRIRHQVALLRPDVASTTSPRTSPI